MTPFKSGCLKAPGEDHEKKGLCFLPRSLKATLVASYIMIAFLETSIFSTHILSSDISHAGPQEAWLRDDLNSSDIKEFAEAAFFLEMTESLEYLDMGKMAFPVLRGGDLILESMAGLDEMSVRRQYVMFIRGLDQKRYAAIESRYHSFLMGNCRSPRRSLYHVLRSNEPDGVLAAIDFLSRHGGPGLGEEQLSENGVLDSRVQNQRWLDNEIRKHGKEKLSDLNARFSDFVAIRAEYFPPHEKWLPPPRN